MVEPKEGAVGTTDLQPVNHKMQRPGLEIGIWSGANPVGLSP